MLFCLIRFRSSDFCIRNDALLIPSVSGNERSATTLTTQYPAQNLRKHQPTRAATRPRLIFQNCLCCVLAACPNTSTYLGISALRCVFIFYCVFFVFIRCLDDVYCCFIGVLIVAAFVRKPRCVRAMGRNQRCVHVHFTCVFIVCVHCVRVVQRAPGRC